jgi:hypothetical protein
MHEHVWLASTRHAERFCKGGATLKYRGGFATHAVARRGAAVAFRMSVSAAVKPSEDRRRPGADRRRNPRSGRRSTDPNVAWRWRRVAWLFAAYAALVSARSMPATIKRAFAKRRSSA